MLCINGGSLFIIVLDYGYGFWPGYLVMQISAIFEKDARVFLWVCLWDCS